MCTLYRVLATCTWALRTVYCRGRGNRSQQAESHLADSGCRRLYFVFVVPLFGPLPFLFSFFDCLFSIFPFHIFVLLFAVFFQGRTGHAPEKRPRNQVQSTNMKNANDNKRKMRKQMKRQRTEQEENDKIMKTLTKHTRGVSENAFLGMASTVNFQCLVASMAPNSINS